MTNKEQTKIVPVGNRVVLKITPKERYNGIFVGEILDGPLQTSPSSFIYRGTRVCFKHTLNAVPLEKDENNETVKLLVDADDILFAFK